MAETSSVDTDELLSGIEPFTSSLNSSPRRSRETSPLKSGLYERSRETSPIKSEYYNRSSRETSPNKSGQRYRSNESSPLKKSHLERSRESSPLKMTTVDKGSPSSLRDSYGERKYTRKADDDWRSSYRLEKTETQSSSERYSYRSSSRDTSSSSLKYQSTKSLPSTPFDRDLAASITQRLMASLQESKDLEETRKSKSMTSLNNVEDDPDRSWSAKPKEKSPTSRQLFSQSHGVYLTSGAGLEIGFDGSPKESITSPVTGRDSRASDVRPKEKRDDWSGKGRSESDDASDKTGSTVRHVPVRNSPEKPETKATVSTSASQSTKPSIEKDIPEKTEFRPVSWREKYASLSGKSPVKSSRYGLSGSMPSLTNMGSILSSLKSDLPKSGMDSYSAKDHSDIVSDDIQDMQNVRDHLHSMLKLGKQQIPNRDSFDHTNDSVTEVLGNTSNAVDTSHGNEESFDSVRTEALISAKAYNDVSPLGTLGYDSGMGLSSKWWNPSSSRSSRTTDTTLYTENQLLRERVEKEMFRRKHCEKQIQQLQSKLLEVQQQLAVAVSTDRKKDVMIEQLDKTLARVVDGWKKHESEKTVFIEKLRIEKEKFESTNTRQQELLRKLESELSQAVEQLTKEQLRASRAESERETQMQKINIERNETLKAIEKERKRMEKLEDDKYRAVKKNEKLEKQVEELGRTLNQERERWHNVEEELQEKLSKVTEEHFTSMNQEKKNLEREKRIADDLQMVLSSVQTELDKVKMELDTAKRDKENLKMEISLLEARHEATQSKMESEHQSAMEKLMADSLADLHEKLATTEAEIREANHRQIQEMTERHHDDLEQRRLDSELELTKKDARLKATMQEYEGRLEDCRMEIADLQKAKQKMELHKSELVAKLQTLMQSHCNEALMLLGGPYLSTSQSLWKAAGQNANLSGISSGILSELSQLADTAGLFATTDAYQGRTTGHPDFRYQTAPGRPEYQDDDIGLDYEYENRNDNHAQYSTGLTTISEEPPAWQGSSNLSPSRRSNPQSYQEPVLHRPTHPHQQFSDAHYRQRPQNQQIPKEDTREREHSYSRDIQDKPRNHELWGSVAKEGMYTDKQDRDINEMDVHGPSILQKDDSFYPLEQHNNTMETVNTWNEEVDDDTMQHHGMQSYHDGRSGEENHGYSTVHGRDSKADYSVLSAGPLENTHGQYDEVPVRFQDTEDKQNELQYYIKMLLDRSPGSPLDQQSDESSGEPEQYSARSAKSDTSTGSCPIKKAVREINMGGMHHQPYTNPPSRPTTDGSAETRHNPGMPVRGNNFPTRDTNHQPSVQSHKPTVAPTLRKEETDLKEKAKLPPSQNSDMYQSPTKDVTTASDKPQPQGVLTPVQVAEISRLLELYRKQESLNQPDGQESTNQKPESLPTANELFTYLREIPQILEQNEQKQKQPQTGVPKARRNLGNQMPKGRQQQIPSRQPIRQQPGSRPTNQLRAPQPNVQLCPHGKGPITKATTHQQKEKKVSVHGVRKGIRTSSVWK